MNSDPPPANAELPPSAAKGSPAVPVLKSSSGKPRSGLPNGRMSVLRVILPLAAVMAMGLGVGLTVLTIDSYREVRARDKAVVAFHEAIILQLTHLKDAETATRGFAITREPRFLEPLHLAEAELPVQDRNLRAGIESVGADAEATEALIQAGALRLAHSRELMHAAAAGASSNPDPAALAESVKNGKTPMDDVRRRSAELEAWADARHRELEHEKDELLLRSNRFIGLLAIAAIALTLALAAAYQSDVRARRREALAHARFRAAIDASPDEIYVVDRNARQLLDVNETAVARTGYSREELLRMDPRDLAPLSRPELEGKLDRVAQSSDRKGVINTRRLRKDGTSYPIEVLICALADEQEGDRFVAVARDITDREHAEQEREHAWRTAELASSSKSEFLSRMSHELRTPLNSILGYAQLMDTPQLGDDDRDSLRHILKAGRHLLALINEVLDITRIEAGRLAISPEVVPLRDIVGETLQMIRPMADARRIAVFYPAATEELFIRADRQRIKQVLVNLVNNAIKFNRDGGMVRIETGASPESDASSRPTVRIKVIDDGPGIPCEFQSRLFQAFERMGADHADVEGTGLGLAVSRRLVELMNGRIGVESEPGAGSTFWVDIPRAERLSALVAAVEEPAPKPESGHPGSVVHTILQIEDNPDNRRLVQKILERQPDIELLTAVCGQEGLELATRTRPDLVVLDLHLPDIDGSEVLTRLRANPDLRDVPIVILSADATPGQIRRLRSMGADDYLTKPLEIDGFLSTIRHHLETGRPSQ